MKSVPKEKQKKQEREEGMVDEFSFHLHESLTQDPLYYMYTEESPVPANLKYCSCLSCSQLNFVLYIF